MVERGKKVKGKKEEGKGEIKEEKKEKKKRGAWTRQTRKGNRRIIKEKRRREGERDKIKKIKKGLVNKLP